MNRSFLNLRRSGLLAGCLLSLPVCVPSANATPVLINFNLHATSGSQFGVSAPATFAGTFDVDSSFLAQANGDYDGSAISNFKIQIGSQLYNQSTAFDPDLQGISLANHSITGIAMNWSQTNAGLDGPYMQASTDGTWEAGSTTNQDGAIILRGVAGSQSFTPEPGSALLLAAAAIPLVRRRRTARKA
jgi:hypothetical protein